MKIAPAIAGDHHFGLLRRVAALHSLAQELNLAGVRRDKRREAASSKALHYKGPSSIPVLE
jgi:hypothetical protein